MLFALQSAGMAHGYAFGDDLHDHDGQLCSIALVAPDSDGLLPVPAVIDLDPPVYTPAVYFSAAISAPAPAFAPRAPPQRGPPAEL